MATRSLTASDGLRDVKGIIFDIGNVLLPFDPWLAVDNLAAASGRSRWLIAGYFYLTQRWTRFDRGRFDQAEFCNRVIKDLSLGISHEEFEDAFSDIFGVHAQVVGVLPELSKCYRLFILSDMNPIHSRRLMDAYDFFDLFEARTFSFEVKTKKPAAEIYMDVLARSGLMPQELAFFDDKPANVRAARRLGIRGVLFENEERFMATARDAGWLD
jgi:putative hydrolase of the HAD superfamily